MRYLHSTKDIDLQHTLRTEYTATICYYNGKEILASQLAIVEYYCAIAIQRIAYSISQSLPVILDLFFCLPFNGIRLIFQTNVILAEILVEAALLQVELVNDQTAWNSCGKYSILYCAMNNDGCIVGMLTSDELMKSVTDGIILRRVQGVSY